MVTLDNRYCIQLLLVSTIITKALPLQFIQEPSHLVAIELQPVWWHCIARGNPEPIVSWLFNDQPIRSSIFEILPNGTLHIASMIEDAAGNYKCQATSGAETITSQQASLSLAYLAESFITQPASVTTNTGQTANFQCSINSNPPATVSWQLNGADLVQASIITTTISMVTSSSLTVLSPNHEDMGSYTCTAENMLLRLQRISESATLILIGRPGFLQPPDGQSAPEGQSVTFSCITIGSPAATIQWLTSSGQQIQSSGRFSVTSSTLTIVNVQQSDAGYYTCLAVNSWGENSASALLVVDPPLQGVTLTLRPTDQSAQVGSRVTFKCEATGSPAPSIVWSKQSGVIPTDRVEEPRQGWLRLLNLVEEDEGVYVCTANNGYTSRTAQAHLMIQVVPVITTSPVDTIVVTGMSIMLHCQASGKPVPLITWTTPDPNRAPIQAPSADSETVQALGNGSLVIMAITSDQSGTYTCSASNTVGTDTSSAIIAVQSPPVFSVRPSNQQVVEGDRAMLQCRAEGNPQITYSWFYLGQKLSSDHIYEIYSNGDLVINNIQNSQEGIYTCEISNLLGSDQAQLFLTVLVPPLFNVRPQEQTITLGQSFRLDCVAYGDPRPQVSWKKDGQQLVLVNNLQLLANGSVMVHGATQENLGTYTCVATNTAGSNQISVNILTIDIPKFITAPTNVTANQGDPASLFCLATARERPIISWYISDESGSELSIVGMGDSELNMPGEGTYITISGSLEFVAVKEIDSSFYKCIATNSIDAISGLAYLEVNFPPRILPIDPVTYTQDSGTEQLHLECIAEGRPTPYIEWILPSGQPATSDSDISGMQGSLSISNPTVSGHHGEFTCLATNQLGVANRSAMVTILGPPVLTNIQITHQETSVTIQCDAIGSPDPTIAWEVNGIRLTGSGIQSHFITPEGALVIQDLDEVESNEYSCIAQNARGSDQKYLKVPESPSPPALTSILSTSVGLAWSQPTSDSDLSITGFKVLYKEIKSSEYIELSEHIVQRSYTVKNLTPYASYIFSLRSVNDLGTGPPSDPSTQVTTRQNIPSEPYNLNAVAHANSFTVRWREPKELNGPAENIIFELRHRVNGSSEQETVVQFENNPPLETLIENLEYATYYEIRMRAGNKEVYGWSEFVILFAKTESNVLTLIVEGIQVTSFGSDAVKISWTAVENSLFESYSIQFRRLDTNKTFILSEPEPTATSRIITGLEPNTTYAFKIAIWSSSGGGPYSEEVIVTTDAGEEAEKDQQMSGSFSNELLAAIIVGAVLFIVLVALIALVAWRRVRSTKIGHIAQYGRRKKMIPDKYWISNGDMYGDAGSDGSMGSNDSGQTGSYNVNQGYNPDESTLSTVSQYELQDNGRKVMKRRSWLTKKRKLVLEGRDDILYKNPDNPDVVLVGKAVIEDTPTNNEDGNKDPPSLSSFSDKQEVAAKSEDDTHDYNVDKDETSDKKTASTLSQPIFPNTHVYGRKIIDHNLAARHRLEQTHRKIKERAERERQKVLKAAQKSMDRAEKEADKHRRKQEKSRERLRASAGATTSNSSLDKSDTELNLASMWQRQTEDAGLY